MSEHQTQTIGMRFPTAVLEHRRALSPDARPLADSEIDALRAAGNSSTDWSAVWVCDDFLPTAIVGCHFVGKCYLGRFDPTAVGPGRAVSQGLYHTTFCEVIVESGVSVSRCAEISGYRICRGASVVGSILRCTGATSFGNGTVIEPGIESGGRRLALIADLDLAGVIGLCTSGCVSPADAPFDETVASYLDAVLVSVGHVGPHASIVGCQLVEDSWVGAAANLRACTCISQSTLLSNPEEPVEVGPGAIVRRSILQEGCRVTDGGIVESSLMLEHSDVERHGKLTTSVLGPNSGVAEGEATACVLGPFTAFHHQALLIAAFWPAGKGNVSYGANVGSNHTSRLPDQEIWPGEGMFFGLGCNVKFPADFSRSPYSIIATGVTTLPQRLSMPFSVITTPTTDNPVPPGLMQLVPGWVLRENLYAVLRNEAKYRLRNRARRTAIEFDVLREDTVALMRDACERLGTIAEARSIYLPGDIPGIGKNFVTETDRVAGIEVYTRYIEYFELWSRAREILDDGRDAGADDRDFLHRLLEHRRRMVADARHSREKDWHRGMRCIDDYAKTHPPVDQDALIVELEKELAELEIRISRLSFV